MVKWSGRTTLHKHKFNGWEDKLVFETDNKALKTVKFLDVQWSICPIEVEDQVIDLWGLYEIGNDRFIIRTSINDLIELNNDIEIRKWINNNWVNIKLKTDAIIQYLREQNLKDDEQIIIHWWW